VARDRYHVTSEWGRVRNNRICSLR